MATKNPVRTWDAALRQLRHLLNVVWLAGGAALAQPTQLEGTYTLDSAASEDVRAAIEVTVSKMGFITRPIARGRLAKANPAYDRLVFGGGPAQVSVQMGKHEPIVTPADGTAVGWRREDGEQFEVSTRWASGALEQRFSTPEGQRLNTYSPAPDGRSLTMSVAVTSPRLPVPLRYKLVYRRSS